MNSIVIIPSLNPNEKLLKLVKDLKEIGINNILIVDDGSTENTSIFTTLENNGIFVYHHDKNYGKGKAIRSAIKYADECFNNVTGYVTADSDGQHLPIDIKNVYNELNKNNENIVLGIRNFENNTPIKSKIGNKFSSLFFKLKTGITLKDTQTGLRGIPSKYKDFALSIIGDRFEYEMKFLINAAKNKILFTQVPINTIYENKNKSSHFRPIIDSFLIYKKLFIIVLVFIILLIIFII